jgi:hypothetical protein
MRTFELKGDCSQVISITQAGVGTPMTVSLNDCILGTLPPPEKLRGVRIFTLDDGTMLTVWVVKKQVQLRHKGLPLSEVRPKAIVSDKMTRRILLLLASLALLLGLPSLSFLALAFMLEIVVVAMNIPALLCFDYCPESESVHPPAFLSSSILTMWFVLLAFGGMLLAILACALGFYHSLTTARQRMALVLGPLLMLEIAGFVSWVLSPSYAGFSTLFLVAFFTSFLAAVVCLVYAGRLK